MTAFEEGDYALGIWRVVYQGSDMMICVKRNAAGRWQSSGRILDHFTGQKSCFKGDPPEGEDESAIIAALNAATEKQAQLSGGKAQCVLIRSDQLKDIMAGIVQLDARVEVT